MPLTLVSLTMFLINIMVTFPCVSAHLNSLNARKSSSCCHVINPLIVINCSLARVSNMIEFNSLCRCITSFKVFGNTSIKGAVSGNLCLLVVCFS